MLRILTAGESHGDGLVGILEGFPANLYMDMDFINRELDRRQRGYGRSSRMDMEKDKAIVISGINDGYSTGNPISIMIKNRGTYVNLVEVTRPRPGHGDLVGALKYGHKGGRNALERASARETAMRVAIGAICKLLLRELDIHIYSHVVQIGDIKVLRRFPDDMNWKDIAGVVDNSPVRVLDKGAEESIIEELDKAKEKGDTLGGVLEVVALGVPVGLGSYAHWDRKLDGRIAQGIMSIPGIKGIEFGLGFNLANRLGSKVHDEIFYKEGSYYRKTNNAGGIEAGVSNGENIVLRAVMKPIPTLRRPLQTVDMESKEGVLAQFERSDVCAVPSASIVAESILAYILADEIMIKFGGDSLGEVVANYSSFMEGLRER
ncbi:MAG TPA: chorismate synthase [Tepidimicrobium sp.]|nr:chorismate synthase [Tepidimicrobium sp.]